MDVRRIFAGRHGGPSLLSTAGSFSAPVGERFGPETLDGYYIDFRAKASAPEWPPPWLDEDKRGKIYVATAQWGLGAFEHFLATGDESWLKAARDAADHLVGRQQRHGDQAGGWVHDFRYGHTYLLRPPWLSGMAQGEGASLLARIALRTGSDRYAEAAVAAMEPMRLAAADGGVRAELGGTFFPEEYPTAPSAYVLNGGIFALWGCRDVSILLDDPGAGELWAEGLETLTREIGRFDTGYWSRYDLFPHPLVNVSSSMYHRLHIDQLRAMIRIAPRPELEAVARRFEGYSRSRRRRGHALARKVAFRLAVPRSELLAHRLPWSRTRHAR